MKSPSRFFFLLLLFVVSGCAPATSTTTAEPLPIVIPTVTSTESVTPTPTSTPTPSPTFTPTVACTTDLSFHTIAYLQTGVQLTFDAPFEITLPPQSLEVKVNETPISEFSVGPSDPNHLRRLYLISKSIKPGDEIDIKLIQDDFCVLSEKIAIPANLVLSTETPQATNVACVWDTFITWLPWVGASCEDQFGTPSENCTWWPQPEGRVYNSCGYYDVLPQQCGMQCNQP